MPRTTKKDKFIPQESIRIPPYSAEAERAILGAILLEPAATFEMLTGYNLLPEWFYIESNRIIFETANRMYQQKATGIDVITVFDALEEAGHADQVGGMAALEALTRGELIVAHAEYYAKILRDKAVLRRIIRSAEEAAAKCYEADRSVDTILSESQEAMFAIGERTDANSLPAFGDSLKQTFSKLDKLFNNKTGLNGLSTGFRDLDRIMQGLRNSEMIVLAARPSMGKTSLAMNICTAIALGADGTGKRLTKKEPLPVAIFSCEMSTDALITRLLCAISHVPYYNIINNAYNNAETNARYFSALTAGADILQNAPIYIDDTGGLDIADVRARARRMKKRYGIRLIMIDYLQLLNCRDASGEGRQLETTRISAGIKAMAKELDIPVIVLSQLSRQTEQRDKEGKPRMSDLRDSGSIEQDADVIMLLRRPCKYPGSSGSEFKDLAVVDVAKNRNGRVGEVKLTFIDELTQFADRNNDENPAAQD